MTNIIIATPYATPAERVILALEAVAECWRPTTPGEHLLAAELREARADADEALALGLDLAVADCSA